MATKVPSKGESRILPNQTLYCTNLPDRIQKQDLRRALYMLFSTYGPILDVISLKTMKMRGQAHIVFRDVQASSQAMRDLQDMEFFGKKMKIEYAKSKSHTIAKLNGTFETPAAAAPATNATDLQRSIFNAPPTNIPPPATSDTAAAGSPQGTKRPREEESDEDVPMEEDDEDAAMEESDED